MMYRRGTQGQVSRYKFLVPCFGAKFLLKKLSASDSSYERKSALSRYKFLSVRVKFTDQ